jgi:hypothetical protein
MVHTDASDTLEKIDRKERELARAYEEQREAKGQAGDEMNLALLRFRARVLSRDIEALRGRTAGAGPRWRRALLAVTTRAAGIAFLSGAVAGAAALSFAQRRAAMSPPDPLPPDVPAVTSPPPAPTAEGADRHAEEKAGQGAEESHQGAEETDQDAGESDQGADEDTDTSPGSDPPHEPLSPADYEKLLARSRAFLRAAQEHDGPALARLSHPTSGLSLSFEQITLKPAELRTCFQSEKRYEVPLSRSESGTRRETCGEILGHVADFVDAPELTFNKASPAATSLMWYEPEPSLFFFIPGRQDGAHELFWKGLTLDFDRMGDDFRLTTADRSQYEL